MSVPDFTTTWTDGENPSAAKDNVAFRNNETWLGGKIPDFGATTVSALAADNSFNDSAAGFPDWALTAGDTLTSSGFTDPDNNGLATIVSATTTKIVVSGATLVDEAAGALIGIIFRQAFTTRGELLLAPEFRIEVVPTPVDPFPEPEFRHTYSGAGGGSEYRYLLNVLGEAFAAQTARLVGSISDTDDGIYELLGQLEWTRTGADEGSLGFSPYYLDPDTETQLALDPKPLEIDSAGHVLINGGTGGVYACEVDGDVRAAEFRQGGAAIGAWTFESATSEMTFDGNAEAETWQANRWQVASTTECDINAARLRGVGWQDQVAVGASVSGVNAPGRAGLPTYTQELTGWTTISVDSADNSFNDSLGSFDFDGLFVPGDTVAFSGFDAAQNNRTFEIVSITADKIIVTGSQVVSEAAGATVDVEFRAGYTTVCQTPALTRAGYYKILAVINVPFGADGNLSNPFGPALFFGKIPGAKESEIYGPGTTKWYCTGKAVGETEQIQMVSRANLRVGDIPRCQIANTSEAAATVTGAIAARWLSTGEDIEPTTFRIAWVFYPPTVT